MVMVRIWRSCGRLTVLATSMMVLALVSGCGGSGGNNSSQDEGGSAPTDSSSPNGGPNTSGGDDGSNGNGDGNGSDEGIAWVPFGPNDPTFPTPSWPAYNAFAAGKCSTLQSYFEGDGSQLGGSDFGKAMLAVCRAAFDGSDKQWSIAEKLAGADTSPLAHDCLASLVTGAMSRAIAWHQAHPGKKPTVKIQREGDGTTDCGQKDHDAQTPPTDESSPTPDETATADETPTPDEAPTTGETTESTG